jgi:hypothetical protein
MMGAYGGQAGASEKDLDRRYKLFGSGIGGAGQIIGDYYDRRRKRKGAGDYWDDYDRFKKGRD